MNKKRREQISNIIYSINMIKNNLEKVLREEETCFDNLSEGLQATMRGMESEESIDCMNEAIDKFDELIDILEEI